MTDRIPSTSVANRNKTINSLMTKEFKRVKRIHKKDLQASLPFCLTYFNLLCSDTNTHFLVKRETGDYNCSMCFGSHDFLKLSVHALTYCLFSIFVEKRNCGNVFCSILWWQIYRFWNTGVIVTCFCILEMIRKRWS